MFFGITAKLSPALHQARSEPI
jgi:tripartite-type tricarboxylate transporter receptor subunit TctC